MKKIKMKGGLDVPLHGSVKNNNLDKTYTKFSAVLADDYFGFKPKILVREGDLVSKGAPLLEDKTNPGFTINSPINGEIHEINRGEKRALVSIVIKKTNDDSIAFDQASDKIENLKNASLWDSFRERPFNRVPYLNTKPDFLFINACKADGLEVSPNQILEGENENFLAGIKYLIDAFECEVNLCSYSNIYVGNLAVNQYVVEGKYPAGNSSIHIQKIKPLTKNTKTWTMNWQDVVRIGSSVKSGNFCFDKYVSICGPACDEPKVVKTNLGANMEELTAGMLSSNLRKVSGSLLFGRSGDSYSDYLTRYSNQISLVSDEREATFFNWLKPGLENHSNSNVFLSSFLKPEKFNFDTNINGGYRAIVPIGVFDEVNPFDIDSTLFLKSLAIADLVALRELGIFDLAEEDMGIFSYVCPSKYDYVALFNDCMEMIWKEETS
ncbi:MAG: NADH:ubiquinone reductase (Na(+)-transporting) subunit A [Gammaproteobacteria bacterium TMED112]|nr:MAG: NADH:ubiquinone reductase (Na(+)-transporting) subunit A [Gammaproteobacteria bacterium TMED112]